MITRRNYAILAAVTFALFIAAGAIGSSNDVAWLLDDIVFFGFLASALLLVGMTVAILVKAASRRRSAS
jgi:hypothetical protein